MKNLKEKIAALYYSLLFRVGRLDLIPEEHLYGPEFLAAARVALAAEVEAEHAQITPAEAAEDWREAYRDAWGIPQR